MKAFLSLLPSMVIASAMPAWAQQGPIPLLPAVPTSAPAAVQVNTSTNTSTNTGTGVAQLTTDSLEYCKELLGRVDALMRDSKISGAEEARNLSQEGERLCQHGRAKSGILHLRQAYVLLIPGKPVK